EIRFLLKTSAGMRDALRRLMQDTMASPGTFAIAPVAAASTDDLLRRHFDRGWVTVAPADGHANQVYIIVEFDDPKSRARIAQLTSDDRSDVAKVLLDDGFEEVNDGIIQQLLDLSDPEVERFVRLFREASSSGLLRL
ncbi:hypothetical protein ACVWWK_003074, partial [Bradyrhizobium sp. LB9.1b]